ncbi:cell division protein FtsL [uncultured Desulfobacter sp.]|uniref:cell division protein FtsL n=1 Tax=uncultured Desulfobacter sp. TaxID=240139 RepID=UPI002AAAF135|nr:cell division protein FtsL [uncultured Desulfobacter sp.]
MNTPKNQIYSFQSQKGLWWFLLIVLLAAELICNAWIRSESSQAMIMIARTESRIRDLANYRQALSVELERLKSEARITRIAHTRLGLTSDTFDQTIYLPKGTN